jgi:hypothetical protein
VCDVSRLTSKLSVESNVERQILPVSWTFSAVQMRLDVGHRHLRWLLRFLNVASKLGEAGESDASEPNGLAMSGQLETRRVFIKQVAGTSCVGCQRQWRTRFFNAVRKRVRDLPITPDKLI